MSERNVKPLYNMYTVASNTFCLTFFLHKNHFIKMVYIKKSRQNYNTGDIVELKAVFIFKNLNF